MLITVNRHEKSWLMESWQESSAQKKPTEVSEKIRTLNKMKNPRIFFAMLSSPKQKLVNGLRSFHVSQVVSQRELPVGYTINQNIDNSLFFTNLPSRKKDKLSRPKKGVVRAGTLLIKCKHENLDHYTGMYYKKFDVIPLASKSWWHRKSKGDYFTILPTKEPPTVITFLNTSQHPAFVTKENLKITFQENGISEALIKQLEKINVTHPTVIQAKVIEKLLRGENVFISAECGSGKTLAYVIAMIENVLRNRNLRSEAYNAPSVIILLPTRELAIQVGTLVNNLGSDLGLNCHSLIGGDIKNLMLHPEMTPVDILTCTLRALNKHLISKLYSTEFCKHVIIDEIDSFVEESFIRQLKGFLFGSKLVFTGLADPTIISPQSAQICFASAAVSKTMETTISDLIKGNQMDVVSTAFLNKVPAHVTQVFMRVGKDKKPEELLKIVKKNVKAKIPTMIFSNRLKTAHWLSRFLIENQIPCGNLCNIGFSSDRLRNFSDFEVGSVDVISCTDLASRGLDFTRVKHVINYEFPTFMIDYIHRCGRTGRLSQGEDCLITNFISRKNEVVLLNKIEMAVRTNSTLRSISENRKWNSSVIAPKT